MVVSSSTSSGNSLRAEARAARTLVLAVGVVALAACTAEAETPHEPGESAPAMSPVELASVEDVDASTLENLSKAGGVRLIDVRSDEEVAEGMIPGAEHIELDKFDPATLDLSDGREPVLYCRSGRRSGIAAEKLSKHLGKPAKHLEGGIRSWEAKGLPVKRPTLF